MRVKLTCEDCVLSMVFCYLIAVLLATWQEFRYVAPSCPQPIQVWLLGDYFTFLVCRWMLVLLQSTFTLFHRRTLACVSLFTFLVLYPFLVVWTAIGTLWFVQIVKASVLECVRRT